MIEHHRELQLPCTEYSQDSPQHIRGLLNDTYSSAWFSNWLGAYMMIMQQENQDFVEQMEADLVRNAHSYIGEAPLPVKGKLLGVSLVNSMMICLQTGKTSKGLETVEGAWK